MFDNFNKNILCKYFIELISIFIVLLMMSAFFMAQFPSGGRKLLLLISFTILFSSFYYHRKEYYKLFFSIFLILISIFCIKLFGQEIINNGNFIKYIAFSVGIINIILLIIAYFNKYKFNKLLNILVLSLLFLPVTFLWNYYFISGAWVSVDTIMAILQTNAGESAEYLKDNLNLKSVALLFFIMPIMIIYFSKTFKNFNLKNKYSIVMISISILLNITLIYKGINNDVTNIVLDTKKYLAKYDEFSKQKERRKNNIRQVLELKQNSDDGVYVLVIGESQNKQHMSAYGYTKDTTPWLDDIKKNSNFLFFENAYSCHTHTVPVLTYALTAKNQYNNLKLENAVSLIEVAEAAGYETVWLSNQVQYSSWDTPVTVIASEANQQEWINSNIGETCMTNFYDAKLAETLETVKISDKMLIIVHLMGNHGSYMERYPKEFNKYGEKNNISKYDNSILYNDFVMQKIYEKAKNIPNFKGLIYFADHADAVDQGLAHDASKFVFEMTDIPMYMYFSDNYIQKNSDKFKALQQSQNKMFTNDLIFNTVLSVMNINIDEIYEKQNDILSESYDAEYGRFKTLYGKKSISERYKK